ncbi:MAG: ankyrin repeat domain-containing protein [Rhodocyclaceae bacterium]|nr:ankyrin repeat domain-containing protein [Rhodocyclaceae bacterium]
MEFSASDWVNVSLTEAILSHAGSPLFVAAERGAIAAVKVMCEAGANVEVLGVRNQRALHVAAAGGHAGIVAILLGAGCEINPQDDDGNTPPDLRHSRASSGDRRTAAGRRGRPGNAAH